MNQTWYSWLWGKLKWVALILVAVLLVAFTAASWEDILRSLGIYDEPEEPTKSNDEPVDPPESLDPPNYVETTDEEIKSSDDSVDDMSDDELADDINSRYGSGKEGD